MITTRALIIGAMLAMLSGPSVSQGGPETYSKAEIDAQLSALKTLISESTYSKPEIDAKTGTIVGNVTGQLQALDQRQEAALAAGNAKIDARITEVTRNLDKRLDTTFEYQVGLIKSIDAKIPNIPWWVNPSVAAFFAFVSALIVALYNNHQNATQRHVEYNQRQAERRIDAAKQVIDNWISRRNGTVAMVNYYLENPEALFQDAQKTIPDPTRVNAVTECGDWYDSISQRWLDNELDPPTLEKMKLGEMLKIFWQRLEHADGVAPAAGLKKSKAEWTHLAKLANG